jgi:protein tyrosine phosphatase (PTP) superfamily phosphohydrolase (DUF442 family)
MTSRHHSSLAVFMALLCGPWAAAPTLEAGQAAPAAVSDCVQVRPAAQTPEAPPRGVSNFGQVKPGIFRGGQPTTEGLRELKQQGVAIVVSFRHEKGLISQERREVESLGMLFVSLPWNALATPTDDEVRKFFVVLRDNANSKIFVHCQQGRDRSGVMVALYRIATDHWCPDSAVAEMNAYHYHHFLFSHLETYVRRFPARLAADGGLASNIGSNPSP